MKKETGWIGDLLKRQWKTDTTFSYANLDSSFEYGDCVPGCVSRGVPGDVPGGGAGALKQFS